MITEVHTSLYSKDFCNILNTLYIEMHTNTGKYGTRQVRNSFVKLLYNLDRETVITISDYYSDYYRSIYHKANSYNDVLKWLAKMFKHYAFKTLTKEKIKWKRNNFKQVVFDKLIVLNDTIINHEYIKNTVYVGDIYCIYDLLNGTKNIDKKYDKVVLNKWRGCQRDPLETEAARICDEKIKTIVAKYNELIEDCNFESYKYYGGQTFKFLISRQNSLTAAQFEMATHYYKLYKEFNKNVTELEMTVGKKWKDKGEQLKLECQEKIDALKKSMSIED